MMRILILGCGSIGTILANAIQDMPELDRIYCADMKKERAVQLSRGIGKGEYLDSERPDLLKALKNIDLVVEAASPEAAKSFIPLVLEQGKDIMIMSVAVFADDQFKERTFELAKEKKARMYIPSGAVCGTDGLRAASMAAISEVLLITKKHPQGMRNNPYLIGRGIDVDSLTEATTVYEGPAREAATLFPKNLNVAATISLLGIGFDKTMVKLVVDPALKRNSHTIVVKGDFGELRAETENVPSPMNPATSYLAALSAVATIRRILGNVWIGV